MWRLRYSCCKYKGTVMFLRDWSVILLRYIWLQSCLILWVLKDHNSYNKSVPFDMSMRDPGEGPDGPAPLLSREGLLYPLPSSTSIIDHCFSTYYQHYLYKPWKFAGSLKSWLSLKNFNFVDLINLLEFCWEVCECLRHLEVKVKVEKNNLFLVSNSLE